MARTGNITRAAEVLCLEQELRCGLTSLERRQSLSFVCTHSFALVYLPDVLRQFMQRCPSLSGTRLEISQGEGRI